MRAVGLGLYMGLCFLIMMVFAYWFWMFRSSLIALFCAGISIYWGIRGTRIWDKIKELYNENNPT